MGDLVNRLWVTYYDPEIEREEYKDFSEVRFHDRCVELIWAGSPCRVVIPHDGVREFSTGSVNDDQEPKDV